MIYKVSTKGKIFSLKWVILFSCFLIPVLVTAIFMESQKGNIAILIFIFIWFLFCFPQLNLFLQYLKATNYQHIEIDYHQKTISISKDGKQLEKKFSDIKRFSFHKANPPFYLGSWWLNICNDFYYYKIDFDEESYYLTSILFPTPSINGEKHFYESYLEVKTSYPSIQKTIE